jgi:hypothetical protein
MSDAIAEAVAANLGLPNAQINMTPAVPEHIAKNVLVFLSRVQCTGPESFAWVEAAQYLQQFAPKPPNQAGVPFPGLPAPPSS